MQARVNGVVQLKVQEQRLSNLLQSLLVGLALCATPALKLIPTSVLWYGLGAGSLMHLLCCCASFARPATMLQAHLQCHDGLHTHSMHCAPQRVMLCTPARHC